MATKRASNGDGSIYPHRDGKRKVVAVSTWQDGKRKRVTRVCATLHEARRVRAELLRMLAEGRPIPDARITVDTLLTAWLEDVVRPTRRPHTLATYEMLARLHLRPALGRLPLRTLDVGHVRALLENRRARGLKPGTLAVLHAALSSALRYAMRREWISRNVAGLVSVPRGERPARVVWSEAEVARFVAGLDGHADAPLLLLALASGLRQGELLALRWQDVDLTAAALTVRHTLTRIRGGYQLGPPKSASGLRDVALPAVVARLLEQQRVRVLTMRLRAGRSWTDADFVFPAADGRPQHTTAVRRRFATLCARLRLPAIPFHGLRHLCATLLLGEGIHVKEIQEQLGHATLAQTMDIYAQVLPTSRRASARVMDDVLRRQG